jgi:hypothetical protein
VTLINNQLVLQTSIEGPNWSLTGDFPGYSNNQVPGFGWEPNSFPIGFGSGWFGLSANSSVLVLAGGPTTLFSFLYISGSRDALDTNVCFNLRTPDQRWLVLGREPGQASLALSGQQFNLRFGGLIAAQQNSIAGYSFQLLLLASSLSLGVLDAGTEAARLGFQSSDLVNFTPATFFAPGQLQFNTPTFVTLTAASQTYVLSATDQGDVRLVPADNQQTQIAFEFVLNTARRLELAFTDVLQGHVNVTSPWALPSQNVQIAPAEFEVVGQRRQAGCARLQIFPQLNWSPEIVPDTTITSGVSLSLFQPCAMRWTSGNAPNNLFFVSARFDQVQTQPTSLMPYPMQGTRLCFVDMSVGQVPPLCGALQLKLYESNLGNFPTGTFVNFESQCLSWAVGPTTTTNDEGLAYIFMSDNNNAANPCALPKIGVPSFENVHFERVTTRIMAIVVPENLLLQINFPVSGNFVVKLGPGTYNQQSLSIIEPRWPTVVVPNFEVYCCTVNPRSIFIAKMCSGFAGARSAVYRPQSSECDLYMRTKCQVDQMFNSSVCACYQDQKRLASMGLPQQLTATMVNRPQCFGSFCALGSGYREAEWLEGCGNICQQTFVGNGDRFRQAGVQTLACNGDIYNFTTGNAPAQSIGSVEPWVIAVFVLAAVAAFIFLVLFAVYVSKK